MMRRYLLWGISSVIWAGGPYEENAQRQRVQQTLESLEHRPLNQIDGLLSYFKENSQESREAYRALEERDLHPFCFEYPKHRNNDHLTDYDESHKRFKICLNKLRGYLNGLQVRIARKDPRAIYRHRKVIQELVEKTPYYEWKEVCKFFKGYAGLSVQDIDRMGQLYTKFHYDKHAFLQDFKKRYQNFKNLLKCLKLQRVLDHKEGERRVSMLIRDHIKRPLNWICGLYQHLAKKDLTSLSLGGWAKFEKGRETNVKFF